ncbi:TRAP transporter substrate-binding protein [Muricoccus radiodurans]|uniref:TRAP transporter substrate-binding protein n=1 Tax=Muricoccus radiodurans TaxID=2231721 RepID=UPI003CEBD0C4
MHRRALLGGALAAPALLSIPVRAQGTITLNGASQFGDDHPYTKAMVRFEELVRQYWGRPINFTLHKNSSLGLEKQYFEYMAQGRAVDYAVVSPAHMSTFSRAAPFIDAPFIFRDLAHMSQVVEQDLFKPISDEVERRARVIMIGYGGGGVRNIFFRRPIRNLAELRGTKVRVQGAPIWSRTFTAIGMSPTVIAYNEIYNAIQNNVIDGGENEAAGVEQMRFYEVAPELSMTQHAITIRPLCFSVATLNRLPNDLQAAIRRAGREASAFHRELESREDSGILERLEREGKLRRVEFIQRAEMKRLVDPVMTAYAREIEAENIFNRINGLSS